MEASADVDPVPPKVKLFCDTAGSLVLMVKVPANRPVEGAVKVTLAVQLCDGANWLLVFVQVLVLENPVPETVMPAINNVAAPELVMVTV